MSEIIIDKNYSRQKKTPAETARPAEHEQSQTGIWLVILGLGGLALWALLQLGLYLLDWIALEVAWTLILGAGLFLFVPLLFMGFCLIVTARRHKHLE